MKVSGSSGSIVARVSAQKVLSVNQEAETSNHQLQSALTAALQAAGLPSNESLSMQSPT